MPLIQIPKVVPPCQIDDFPAYAQRSQKGAIYFLPGSTRALTEDEWAHIRKVHFNFARKLIVVPYDDKTGRIIKKKSDVPPPSEQPTPPMAMPLEPMTGKKKSSKSAS